MGVNMPTRTVVFASVRKHDGKGMRELATSEFIQMSGRAGRRGLDTVGTVLISCFGQDGVPDEPTLQLLLLGRPTRLESKFRLTYTMILNMLRLEDFRVEDLLRRSFSEAESVKSMPKYERVMGKLKRQVENMGAPDCLLGDPEIEGYHQLYANVAAQDALIRQAVQQSPDFTDVMCYGRVVVVRTDRHGTTLGFVLRQGQPVRAKVAIVHDAPANADKVKSFQVFVLRAATPSPGIVGSMSGLPPYDAAIATLQPLGETVDVVAPDILQICAHKFPTPKAPKTPARGTSTSNALYAPDHLQSLALRMLQLWQAAPEDGPPLLDYQRDMKLNSLDVADAVAERQQYLQLMQAHKCRGCTKLTSQFERQHLTTNLTGELDKVQFMLSDENLLLMPDLRSRVTVLRELQYVKGEVVDLKGRVACEISSANELLVTEMVFESMFTTLSPEHCVAMLACLVCQDKNASDPTLDDDLSAIAEKLITLAKQLGERQQQRGVDTDPTEFAQKTVNVGLMEVAHEWAKGTPFAEICELTTVLEGSIVRSITQLDQACREVRNAARVVGDVELYQKMERSSELIKRDIVFASSLYIT
eukprot:NODE_405_length_1986_cov_43.363098_g398_i0.p1 GENE.NODE_405_length_1986_cov_43.363098_g398_i0~~NODE_405_length_1986_cov_43.363098_g398_i0.p1  ORF type:complete len:656 (+),score=193.56 NODE_405_length_1986_cov_43.363098_g398_i0:206-1969(+)